MTSRILITLNLVLSGASAFAQPFTLRTLPGGLDFAATEPYDTQQPMAADFDRDGHRDSYWGGSVISRFPKSGTLNLPVITIPQYPAATVVPLAGAVLDVDQDGDTDIVRINRWNGWSDTYTLQAFVNNGQGSFTAGWRGEWSGPSFDEGWHYYKMEPGDFDRDGDVDLALLTAYGQRNYDPSPDRFEGSLKILWNHNAQFASSTMIQSTGFSYLSHLAAGDPDRDGDLDLICSDQTLVDGDGGTSSSRRTFTNAGSGVFTAAGDATWCYRILLHDVNRDGWDDLISEPGGQDFNLFWRQNDKNGGFLGQSSFYNNGGFYADEFALADGDEDGITDLVIAEGGALVLRPGNGKGAYGNAIPLAALPSGLAAIGADDLDCDGDTDFLIRLKEGGFRFLENRAPRLNPLANYADYPLPGIEKLQVADMNRDGIPDVLALEPGDQRIHYLRGQSNGGLAAAEFKLTNNQNATDFTVADLNRDGREDLAYVLPGSGQVRQVLQNDAVYFAWPDTKVGDLAGASMIRAGDYGLTNGSPDLMAGSTGGGGIRWFNNNGSASAWAGHDMASGITPPPLGILTAPYNPKFGDHAFFLSADGALQLKGYQHFFLTTPPWVGAFNLLQIHDKPQTGAMLAQDLDGDGVPEIVFGSGTGELVWWKPSNQLGATATVIDAAPLGTVRGLAAADWNRDGRTDILCATSGGLTLHVRNGSGWTRQNLAINTVISDVKAADFNRDGLMDAVASDPATGKVRIHYNRSRLVAAGAATLPAGGVLGLKPGANGHAFSIAIRNPGRATSAGSTHLPEQPIAVTGSKVRFFKAVPDGAGWKKGGAMTKSEVGQAVASVALVSNGTVIGSTGPAAVADDGSMEIPYHPVLGNLVSIPPDTSLDLQFRVTLKATAADAGYTTFYLAHGDGEPGSARSFEGGVLGDIGLFGKAVESRVEILPDHSALEVWRQTHFGSTADSGSAANDHDHDGDGLPNLVEYVLGTDPKVAETANNAVRSLMMDTSNGSNGNAFARLWVTDAVLADPDIRLTIQQSDNLATWTTLATRTGGGSWTGVTPTEVSFQGFSNLIFNTGWKPAVKKRHFVRLQVDELP